MKPKSKSVLSNKPVCFVCGSPYVEVHHIFKGNKQRKLSDKHGCWVYLCREHHMEVHDNSEFDHELQRMCQEEWMEVNCATKDDFREVFGKNYV